MFASLMGDGVEQRDDWHLTQIVKHDLGRGDPFAAAVRATRMPMVITDPSQPDNPIVFCNEAFQTLTGYDREEIIGRNCRFLQGPDTDSASVTQIREAIGKGTNIEIDILNYRKDGSTFWNALYLSPVRDDDGTIQFFFASQLDVSSRIDAQAEINRRHNEIEREVDRRTAQLNDALEAKTLLLHEVDHRVKNNLTMIGSLLRLQARTINEPAITAKIEAMLERIDALATVHRRLYQSEDVSRFDIGAFTANLVSDVVGASGRDDLAVSVDVEPIEVPSGHAASLGLVLNEILTNAIKHGFAAGRSGTLSVSARKVDGQAIIAIADDGPGMSETHVDGLGRILITRLSKPVGAQAAWEAAHPGTQVRITFPVEL
jgi:PAS domain S-box-containing protein